MNPAKTILVLFTKKTDLSRLCKYAAPHFTELSFSTELKYLGVVLGSKLRWNRQIKQVTDKTTFIKYLIIEPIFTDNLVYHGVSKVIGNNLGNKPKMRFWMYTTLVRPIVIWWEKSLEVTTRKILNKLQRLASVCAIEMIVDLTPKTAMGARPEYKQED